MAVALLTHGISGRLYSTDGDLIPIDDITRYDDLRLEPSSRAWGRVNLSVSPAGISMVSTAPLSLASQRSLSSRSVHVTALC